MKTPSEFYGDSIVCGWTRLSKPPFMYMYLPKPPGASFTRSISCIPEWIIKHETYSKIWLKIFRTLDRKKNR